MSKGITGKKLSIEYGVNIPHSLYSERGNFYEHPKGYPALLWDSNGYLRLDSMDSLNGFGISVRKKINIHKGISSLAGYVLVKPQITALPEEVSNSSSYWEGIRTTITVNRYERDGKARNVCIEHYGCKCAVCETCLEDIYGEIARGFIHVHHLVPIATIGEKYEVDPVGDLRPVCPNCHAIMHRQDPPLSLEATRLLLASNRAGK